jgi:hypothetical protein
MQYIVLNSAILISTVQFNMLIINALDVKKNWGKYYFEILN